MREDQVLAIMISNIAGGIIAHEGEMETLELFTRALHVASEMQNRVICLTNGVVYPEKATAKENA